MPSNVWSSDFGLNECPTMFLFVLNIFENSINAAMCANVLLETKIIKRISADADESFVVNPNESKCTKRLSSIEKVAFFLNQSIVSVIC